MNYEGNQQEVFSNAGGTKIAGKDSSPQIVGEQRPSLVAGKCQLMKMAGFFEVPNFFSMLCCHRGMLTNRQKLAEPVAHISPKTNGALGNAGGTR
jgi:hypothetical protein